MSAADLGANTAPRRARTPRVRETARRLCLLQTALILRLFEFRLAVHPDSGPSMAPDFVNCTRPSRRHSRPRLPACFGSARCEARLTRRGSLPGVGTASGPAATTNDRRPAATRATDQANKRACGRAFKLLQIRIIGVPQIGPTPFAPLPPNRRADGPLPPWPPGIKVGHNQRHAERTFHVKAIDTREQPRAEGSGRIGRRFDLSYLSCPAPARIRPAAPRADDDGRHVTTTRLRGAT